MQTWIICLICDFIVKILSNFQLLPSNFVSDKSDKSDEFDKSDKSDKSDESFKYLFLSLISKTF
ncbi:MAG: hypothetical protein EHM58_17565 [Ignavibacteriae bacterium]|nr:MAG: hypothetical protein EHM58_17565 [Ignavibacteriota bacterium]